MFLCLKYKEVLENEKCLLINFSDEMGGDEGGAMKGVWCRGCGNSRSVVEHELHVSSQMGFIVPYLTIITFAACLKRGCASFRI